MTNPVYWQDLIALFQKSGLTQIAFCQEHKLKIHTFRYWYQKLSKHTNDELPQNSFITLTTISQEISPTNITLQYPNGVILKIESSSSLAQIAALIALANV